MKVIPLSEGAFTIDASKKFVAFDPASDDLQGRTTGSLLVEIQPFVVVTSKDILLFDTGLGYSQNGRLQIHQLLEAHGIGAGEVTKVILSHLHKDHAGGIAFMNSQGVNELSFPHATYYLQKEELAYALSGESPSYLPEQFSILEGHAQVELLTAHSGLIDGYIQYELTGAHSKFHQVLWVKEDQEIVFYGADDAPQLGQMKNRFIAKYDFDGRKCMELRKKWWQQGEQEHWNFLFYHDVKSPTFQF